MTHDELKTLILLSGHNRLIDLEDEIFAASEDVIRLYLHALHKNTKLPNTSTFALIYYYAWHVLGERWPAAEAYYRRHNWCGAGGSSAFLYKTIFNISFDLNICTTS